MVRPMRVLILAIVVAALGMSFCVRQARSEEPAALFQSDLPAPPGSLSGFPLRSLKERFVNEAIQRSLQKQVSVDYTDAPLVETLTNLAKEHHLPLWVDKAALIDEGINVEDPVTLRLANVSIKSVLRLICEPMQLTWVVDDDALVVTTSVRSGAANEACIYEVGHLLYRKNADELIEVLTACVDPDSWDEVGGAGSVRALNDPPVLVVRQSQSVQNEIGELLSELQQKVGGPVAKEDPAAPRDLRVALRERLTASCDVDADDVALDQLLANLTSKQRIPLWIDHATLGDEGIHVDQPVTIHLKGIRLESALRLILKPLDLAFVIDDEILKITTNARAAGSLSTQVYDVRDLARPFVMTWPPKPEYGGPRAGGTFGSGQGMGGGMFQVDETPRRPLLLGGGFGNVFTGLGGAWGNVRRKAPEFDLDELVKAITSTIQPDSWDEVGGAGSIRDFRNTLVVRQTGDAHREIGGLLRNLRIIKRRQAEQPPVEEKAADAMTRIVYDLTGFDYPPAELAQLIPDLVAPSTWQSANQGGSATLHVQPNSLVITQTKANHAEIVKLLYEVVLKFEE